MHRKTWILALSILALLTVATSAAIDLDPHHWFVSNSPSRSAARGPVASALAGSLTLGPFPSYRAIAQQVRLGVVGVTLAGLHVSGPDESPADLSDPFLRFFRGLPGFTFHQSGQGQAGKLAFFNQGSGFIISADGLILTNAHVVREAREVIVKLNDRREFKAKVIGVDTWTDIALLRVDASQLPALYLGDSQQLQMGDIVLAMGSRSGFEPTVTQGVVSGQGRSLSGDSAVPFIQTDAVVGPGNSGGPLFDASGAVVGITAQIHFQSGANQGPSFAVPIHVALKIKDQILATGHASHARLGVSLQDLDQALAESFGLSRPDGALISEVLPDSAAARAGLVAGDIVTQVNGDPITRSGDLSSQISLAMPGDTVMLKVWREYGFLDTAAKLGQSDDAVRSDTAADLEIKPGQLGLSLRPLTRDEQSKAHLQGGLLVEAVTGSSATARLLPGDVVLAILGRPLNSVEQFRSLLARLPNNVALLILRGGERLYISAELG